MSQHLKLVIVAPRQEVQLNAPQSYLFFCRIIPFKLLARTQIAKEQVSFAMQPGILDLITVIPKNEVERWGIPYIRQLIEVEYFEEEISVTDKNRWDNFWLYFIKNWIPGIHTWNISMAKKDQLDLNNRTNNGLERYNRTLNSETSPHPNLLVFIDMLKRHASYYVKLLEDIKHGRAERPTHKACTIPKIPDSYQIFKKAAKP